jgi:RNA polymerase sigma factor (sigma-70 family)
MADRDPLENPRPLIDAVYAYVAYRIGHGADAEDVTSDVFERALRYRSSYDKSKAEPLAWLIGIARRSIVDYLSRPKAVENAEVAEREPAASETAVAQIEDAALDRVWLEGVLGRLGDRDRDLIALRYGADLTSRQIASLLGERPNTVEVALHRALRRLREDLDLSRSDRVNTGDPALRSAAPRP